MPYTNPTPTLADEALITKTWSDTIYDNLYHLQKRTRFIVNIPVGGTTTSASAVVVSGTGVDIVVPVTSDYMIIGQVHVQHSVANGAFVLGVAVDGVIKFTGQFNTQLAVNTNSMYHFAALTNLAAGTRTIALVSNTGSGGTTTITAGYGSHFILWEIGA